ncbi:MAG: DUF4172 domain-containing protein [Nitrosomonas sp.]|nr:DUF4172 domain-containing protein [Nitrosomonas sp.]
MLAQLYHAQGHLLGRTHDPGLGLRNQANLQVMTEVVLKVSEIEGG